MIFIALLCLLVLSSVPAFAYIGPGLAIPAVAIAFGMPTAIAFTVLLLSYFPLRYFYKKYQHKKREKQQAKQDQSMD